MDVLNKELRKRILEKCSEIKLGHLGAVLSCLDCVSYLYDNVLEKEDIFILSKGHAAPALYCKLEQKGKNPQWTMHPELNEELGIFATTGSLGHGLPIAIGRAFARKIQGKPGKVYVLLGDGEMQEGSNWEALMIANKLALDNLIILIDWNKYQAISSVADTLNMDDLSLAMKLKTFGYNNITKINGHDNQELAKIKNLSPGINIFILDTIKGKGVEILEKGHDHVYYFSEEELKKALDELDK